MEIDGEAKKGIEPIVQACSGGCLRWRHPYVDFGYAVEPCLRKA